MVFQTFAVLGMALTSLQADTRRADAVFDNLSYNDISVFVKGLGKCVGPIRERGSVFVEGAFKVGLNDVIAFSHPWYYSIPRYRGDGHGNIRKEDWRSLVTAIRPIRIRVQDPGKGKPLKAVTVDFKESEFLANSTLAVVRLAVKNETGFPIVVYSRTQSNPAGPVGPRYSETFGPALSEGTNDLVIIAMKSVGKVASLPDWVADVCFKTVKVPAARPGEAKPTFTLLVTEKDFGPHGIQGAPPPPPSAPVQPRATIEGVWNRQDGTVLRIENGQGYYEDVGYLKNYQFKNGELGMRNFKEDPRVPGTFHGEVLFKFQSGKVEGWHPITIRLVNEDTIMEGTYEWKRKAGSGELVDDRS